MKPFCKVVAFAFVISVSSGVAAADDNTIPGHFDFKFGGDPLWISASEAITASGTLRADIRRPAHLKRLIAQRQEREAGGPGVTSQAAAVDETCEISFAERFTEGPDEGAIPSLEVLEEMVSTRSVIDGTVSATAVGIHEGMPYTILQIDVSSKEAPANRVYLMYPKGRLRFDGMTFCNDDSGFSSLPAIGDPILFIASYPLDSTGTLYFTSWVVYEHQSAVVSSPRLQLESTALPGSVRSFAERLRASRQRDKQQ